jgi:RNA polymerase sigma-70 factor (ECF subfamily)
LIVAPSQQERIELQELSCALDQLTPDQRQLILLVGLEGLTYEATAKVMNLPVGTVMSRLFRAREVLRKMTDRRGSAGQAEEKAERVNGKKISRPADQHEDTFEFRVRR